MATTISSAPAIRTPSEAVTRTAQAAAGCRSTVGRSPAVTGRRVTGRRGYGEQEPGRGEGHAHRLQAVGERGGRATAHWPGGQCPPPEDRRLGGDGQPVPISAAVAIIATIAPGPAAAGCPARSATASPSRDVAAAAVTRPRRRGPSMGGAAGAPTTIQPRTPEMARPAISGSDRDTNQARSAAERGTERTASQREPSAAPFARERHGADPRGGDSRPGDAAAPAAPVHRRAALARRWKAVRRPGQATRRARNRKLIHSSRTAIQVSVPPRIRR